jgi:hypothetical protein
MARILELISKKLDVWVLINMLVYLRFSIIVSSIVAIFACVPVAFAETSKLMTISYEKPKNGYEKILGSAWTIFLEGEIDGAAADRFAAFVTKNEVPVRSHVVLNSPGGNLYAGMELGRIIRKYDLTTDVGDPAKKKGEYSSYGQGFCYSACTYAYLGGRFRYMTEGSHFGVHRFYAKDPASGNMDSAQMTSAQIVSYVREMGVDPDFFTLSTYAGAKEIIEPPKAVLEKLNVINYGMGPTTWTMESHQGVLYLKGQRDTQYGINKYMLICGGMDGIVLHMIFDPQGRQDEVMEMHAHSLVIDGQDEPVDVYKPTIENGWFNGVYFLTKSQLSRIMKADTVGVILRWSYEGPVFLGFNSMPFAEGREKLIGLVNNCKK